MNLHDRLYPIVPNHYVTVIERDRCAAMAWDNLNLISCSKIVLRVLDLDVAMFFIQLNTVMPGSLQRGNPLSEESDFMPASITALPFSGRLMTVARTVTACSKSRP